MSARTSLLVLLLAAACSGPGGSGPADITWDRDTCTACNMVISDHHFAAEVRGGPRGRLFKFDDLGCALKWLDQQPWADAPETRVWVARQSDGQWLDGRTARYVGGRSSPMGYNFGAVDPGAEGNDFTAQRAAVRALAQQH